MIPPFPLSQIHLPCRSSHWGTLWRTPTWSHYSPTFALNILQKLPVTFQISLNPLSWHTGYFVVLSLPISPFLPLFCFTLYIHSRYSHICSLKFLKCATFFFFLCLGICHSFPLVHYSRVSFSSFEKQLVHGLLLPIMTDPTMPWVHHTLIPLPSGVG